MYFCPFRFHMIHKIQYVASSMVLAFVMLMLPNLAHAQAAAPEIIGGEQAQEDAYPWAVALFKSNGVYSIYGQFCGGTLLAPEWVLTAAHCTFNGTTPRTPESISAVIGSSLITDKTNEPITISQIIRHPNYDRATATADIALLRLSKPSTIPVVKLGNSATLSTEAAAQAMVIGWGKTETSNRSEALLEVNVPIVPQETCKTAYALYGYIVNDSMICAGHQNGGQDACSGDSGGPLIAPLTRDSKGEHTEWVQIGVVSWGKGCAQANAYGVYANVAQFTTWISLTTSGVGSSSSEIVSGQQGNLRLIFLPFVQG